MLIIYPRKDWTRNPPDQRGHIVKEVRTDLLRIKFPICHLLTKKTLGSH